MSSTGIIWFRNDLRVADNEALVQALKRHDCIIPVFVFDPRILQGKSRVGLMPRFSAHRFRFLESCVNDLSQSLESLGGKLLKAHGHPEEILPELCVKYNASEVYYHEQVASEERNLEARLNNSLTKINVASRSFVNSTLVHPNDLPFSSIHELPDVFTSFRVEVEKSEGAHWRTPVAPPNKITVPAGVEWGNWPTPNEFGFAPPPPTDSRSAVQSLAPGETGAWKRLDEYLWISKGLSTYKETRNGLVGEAYSSKFSPYLSHGCITPRCIAAEISRYERQVVKNDSTYWLIFELLWRDFFQFVAQKFGTKLYHSGGIKGAPPKTVRNYDHFEAWKAGNTGVPFIDANMRELAATGFMSNRGRQNVASFLVKDLELDWRLGAEYFESQLLDYDPCSNWGNWNYSAGVGCDPRENRYFNVIGQGSRYDPKGEYTKLWVPELSAVPLEFIQTPWKLQSREHESTSVIQHYPPPIVPVPRPQKQTLTSKQHAHNATNQEGRNASRKKNGKFTKPAHRKEKNT